MSIAIPYIYFIALSAIFGFYNGWQWIDDLDGPKDTNKAKPKWKGASVALRMLWFVAPAVMITTGVDVYHYVLAFVISWPVFDMTINLTRGVPLFYLGSTSTTDKLGKWKWIGYGALIAAMVAIKFIT